METSNLTRRSFFKLAAVGAAIIPAIFKASTANAAAACGTAPAGKPVLAEKDAMWKSNGYVADANSAKDAKYKKGSNCASCKFYNKGKEETGYAPCTMMGMKFVSNCGWCTKFAAKA